jgi:DNA-binding NtrC family response regulator
MHAELFARLLIAPGAPFVECTAVLADPVSELLGRVSGGILFVPDLKRLELAEQKTLEFVLGRAERHRVRIVSFSSIDVRTLVDKHDMDPELAAKLSELTLRLPALREFQEDLPELAALMLAHLVESRACPARRLSTAALNALRQHSWPGNLAEFESVIKDLALTSLDEIIGLEDAERALGARSIPADLAEIELDGPYRDVRDAFDRLYFERLLSREQGSMSRVADRSGLERTHLYRKLKALGLPVGRREDN